MLDQVGDLKAVADRVRLGLCRLGDRPKLLHQAERVERLSLRIAMSGRMAGGFRSRVAAIVWGR